MVVLPTRKSDQTKGLLWLHSPREPAITLKQRAAIYPQINTYPFLTQMCLSGRVLLYMDLLYGIPYTAADHNVVEDIGPRACAEEIHCYYHRLHP